MRSTRPVLIVGDNELAGLQSVRSLGRMGLPVHLVTFEPRAPTRKSRFVQRTFDFGHPLIDSSKFVDSILELVANGDYSLVLPTSDKSLVPLMARHKELRRFVPFAAPEDRGFHSTHCKSITVSVASRAGICVPITKVVHDTDSPLDLDELGGFPVVVKPDSSVTLGRSTQSAVRIAYSLDEAEQLREECLKSGPVLFQKFCPGVGLGVGIIADKGEVFGAFQYRRVHEPPQGGPSTYRVSEPLSQPLLEKIRRFCAETEWTGPAMFEFKVAENSSEPVLMEVNGRMWGSIVLPICAGIDFPKLTYELFALEKKTPSFEYRIPYYARHLCRDAMWFQANIRCPRGKPDVIHVPLRKALSEWGHVLAGRESFDIESLTDPAPMMNGWFQFIRDTWGRVHEKVAQRIYNHRARRSSQIIRLGRRNTWLKTCRSILFLCAGNINRSAFAAGLLGQIANENNLELNVGSAGLFVKECRKPTRLSIDVAAEFGIDLSAHLSQQVTKTLLDKFDVIVVMESAQFREMATQYAGNLPKTVMMSAFDMSNQCLDVVDPQFTSRLTFNDCYERISRCVTELYHRMIPANPVASSKPAVRQA